jgi:outer membrane protein assembly factor BamB
MKTPLFAPILAAVALAAGSGARIAPPETNNWPQWRGPSGNGTSAATGLPTSWGPDKNIVWKTEMPSWSGSTPVIWGDRIYLTSPSRSAGSGGAGAVQVGFQQPGGGRGRFAGGGNQGGFGAQRDPGGQELLLYCLSKTDGKILWQRQLDTGNRVFMKHNNTSPSPVAFGNRIWAMTGTGAVSAFDMEGRELWRRNLQKDYGQFGLNWGYGSSPIYYEGNLIIEVLHGCRTDDPSYIVALNGETGQEVWKQIRPTDAPNESPDAYTTPAIMKVDGKDQLIISGGDYVTGHDPKSGKELWRCGGLNPNRAGNFRIVGSPVVCDGMVYAPSRNRPILALKPSGTGDISDKVVWRYEERGPDVPTPVCDGKYFYVVNDAGVASCLDAKTGKTVWGPERTAPGTVDSSPLLADGKIYITNESGVTTVLAAGPEFKVLSTNELDGSYTLSSIAVSGKQLFLRTGNALYCVGEKAAKLR